eukprot:Phypoly_transcript_16217.p1 GENE.Phypoly_transcript_16217~~Phypoly_transcript_16217.p1  ORF type:complete len:240 (+),score=28.10 Phypoly_transcript_16217:128-847(+)
MRSFYIVVVITLFVFSVAGYPSYGEWAPPGPDDSRSPCPAVNVLANHGYIPRNGKGITLANLTAALENVYRVSTVLAYTLTGGGILLDGSGGSLDLADLDSHNSIEHDASMTRDDYYFGDNHSINQTLLDGLIATSKDGEVLTQDDFAQWQSLRHKDSAARNPTYTFGFKQKFLGSGEPALFLMAFGTEKDGIYSAPIASVRSVFGLEKLPEGWQGPETQLGAISVHNLASAIKAKWDP